MTMEAIKTSRRPLAVYITEAGNASCQDFEPILQQAAGHFAGKIELLRHPLAGADDPILRELMVLEIPSVVVFNHGREIARLAGCQPLEALEGLFGMALAAQKRGGLQLSRFDRLIRLMVGLAIILFGYVEEQSWILMGLGMILILTAFADRFKDLYRKWVGRKGSL